jgi:cell division topological specificity factor
VKLFERLRRRPATPAHQAKERLQILLAHERKHPGGADFLPRLQRDLLEVIAKYIQVDREAVNIQLSDQGTTSRLEVDIEIPAPVETNRRAPSLR